ncbi:MAG: hypothetical protein P8M22_03280 [Phycisphaerales bacterium]|nr:hypothetical protein [Phycisphaerales bacterium]
MNTQLQLEIVLIAQAVSTFGMLGVIWLVQIGTYPLLVHVPADNFVKYQSAHMYRITFVVGPLMLVEAGTAAWLLFLPLNECGTNLAWIGMGLVFLLWISTLILQVPCHWKLEKGRDDKAISRLVATNWVRTLGWTARAVVVGWLLVNSIQ